MEGISGGEDAAKGEENGNDAIARTCHLLGAAQGKGEGCFSTVNRAPSLAHFRDPSRDVEIVATADTR